MKINIENILQSIITAGVLGLCAIAWGTYNEFIVLVTKVDYITDKLAKNEALSAEISAKMQQLEKRIFILEHKIG